MYGLSAYSLFYQIEGSESEIMRALQFSLHDFTPLVFRTKIQNQLILQFGQLYKLLGQNVLAPAFFLALMQIIDLTKTALYRWCVLLMWSMAALGMAVFGLEEKGLMANDLHVLFIPLMVFYGLGFVREHWSNLHIRSRFAQLAFVPSLYCLSALPLISSILDREKARFHWPPYVPPCIAVFREWTGANEIIASDIPWAVAWYADRKSLWLPATQKDFITLNDYEKLGGKTVGIYLTPVRGFASHGRLAESRIQGLGRFCDEASGHAVIPTAARERAAGGRRLCLLRRPPARHERNRRGDHPNPACELNATRGTHCDFNLRESKEPSMIRARLERTGAEFST